MAIATQEEGLALDEPKETVPLHIVGVKVENFLKIRCLHIRPSGEVTVIGGPNGAGKTSFQRAMIAALGGAKYWPDEPVRRGAKKATVEVDLDGMVVKASCTTGGKPNVTIESKDGSRFASPQSLLNALINPHNFDISGFLRKDETADGRRRQMQLLLDAKGVDVTDLDAKRQELYDERTGHNADAKSATARLEKMGVDSSWPDEEVDVVEITRKLGVYRDIAQKHRERATVLDRIHKIEEEIEELRLELETKLVEAEFLKDQMPERPAESREELQASLDTANETNRKAQAKRQWAEARKELEAAEENAENCTRGIGSYDQGKRERIAGAEWSVPGLEFADDGIRIEGVPFPQCSHALRLVTSLCLAVDLNSRIRACWLSEWHALDSQMQKLVCDIAREQDFHVFAELVAEGDDPRATVMLEQGEARHN